MVKSKGTKVSSREKQRMWELYDQLRTYKAVAKKMRGSPDTVARYVREYELAHGLLTVMSKANDTE